MTQWVALLRGVNVNGITIRSADLADLFRARLGFDDVRTVLASGNVRFTSAGKQPALKTAIEAALRERFAYDAWIVLLTADELQAAVHGFPFDADDPARQPYVVFASDPAAIDTLAAAAEKLDHDVDPVQAGDGILYWNPMRGSTTTTPFARELARPVYKRTTTNRNLRTLVKLTA